MSEEQRDRLITGVGFSKKVRKIKSADIFVNLLV